MARPRLHNFARMARYAVGGASLSAAHLLIRKGPRAAAAHLVRAGRMRDRDFGRGLPLITVVEILRKLGATHPIIVHIHPWHTATISSDPKHEWPNFLVGLIAAAVKPLHALEVGTGTGRSTCQIAAQVRGGGSVVTIAPPREWSDPQARPSRDQLTEEHMFSDNGHFAWERTPFADRIQIIRTDSRMIDYAPLNRRFNFVFIDGSHTEAAVRQDTERVLPFLADGAVFLWHDYESSVLSHGVDRYLHRLSQTTPWPIHIIEYTTLAIQIRRPQG